MVTVIGVIVLIILGSVAYVTLFNNESMIYGTQKVVGQHTASLEKEKLKTAFTEVRVKQDRKFKVDEDTAGLIEEKLNTTEDSVVVEISENGNFLATFEETGNVYELTKNGLILGESYIAEEVFLGIPIYTWLDLKKMGSGETIYDSVTKKTYTYALGETYVLRNNITFYENFSSIQNLINTEQIILNENGYTITFAEVTDKSYFTYSGGTITGLSSLGIEKYNSGELTELVFPTKSSSNTTITTIAENAFNGKSNITSIYIPNGYTTININAFKDCTGITEVIVPGSITTMKYDSFRDCTGLYRVIFLGNTLPAGADIDNGIFWGCSNLKIVEFRGTIPRLRNGTVANTGIERIVIPNTVTSIGQGVFANCTELVEIVIPDSVTSIEENAFYGCTKLKRVIMSNNIASIGQDAFAGCTGLIYAEYGGTRVEWARVTKGTGNDKLCDLIYNENSEELHETNNNISIAYVEATGTQYIDTGFKANQNTTIEVKFEFTTEAEGFIYGARQAAGKVGFGFTHYTAATKYRFDYANQRQEKTTLSTNTQYIVRQVKNECYIDGTKVHTYTSGTFETPCNVTIFAINTNGSIGGYAKARIYYLKIWDNGTLIRDYVPVYNNVLDEAGLYDQVGNSFSFSLGTDALVAPPQE